MEQTQFSDEGILYDTIPRCSMSGIWVFPKIRVKPPKWMVKMMENPIKMDDLGVPLFLKTPISINIYPQNYPNVGKQAIH